MFISMALNFAAWASIYHAHTHAAPRIQLYGVTSPRWLPALFGIALFMATLALNIALLDTERGITVWLALASLTGVAFMVANALWAKACRIISYSCLIAGLALAAFSLELPH